MRKLAGGLVLVVVLLVLGRLVTKRSSPASATDSPTTAEGSGSQGLEFQSPPGSAAPTSTSAKPAEQRVVRLTPEERLRVASQIAAAQKAHAASAPPRLPDNGAGSADDGEAMATAQQVLKQLQKVADDVRGYVAECAKYAPELKSFTTQITLTGDSDIGTLIDAPTPALGSNGQQVPSAFDNCIRGQLQTLELPPMKTGDKFTVDYDITL